MDADVNLKCQNKIKTQLNMKKKNTTADIFSRIYTAKNVPMSSVIIPHTYRNSFF